MNEIRKKKKTRKVTISRHNPRVNRVSMDIHMRQGDNPIIGTISEPIIMEVPIKEKKKDKKKK